MNNSFDVKEVAEDLGISHAAAFKLLDQAMGKLRTELAERESHYSSRSEPDWKNERRFTEWRNFPLGRAVTLVNSCLVAVQGDEDRIGTFTRTLFRNLPEIETIDRKPANSALGDAALELRFQLPVSVRHATRALEVTAGETGVILSTVGYSHSEP